MENPSSLALSTTDAVMQNHALGFLLTRDSEHDSCSVFYLSVIFSQLLQLLSSFLFTSPSFLLTSCVLGIFPCLLQEGCSACTVQVGQDKRPSAQKSTAQIPDLPVAALAGFLQ